ncbi:ribonuclease HII [Helicobacter japonicus]|uniref:Ribonuclease n=2 Tax=Helicobacter japonicus TaxID=425400 RepID=A0A4U8TIY2_9HELI|nr:ribonuclease HII [Helicobacter japonicus]TLE00291.1 ribonuclease HII [Helicobacter japonicus]
MWVAGIDEAGRGCLCGSLFVAGVIGKAHIIESFGAKDSKRLSPKRREYIYESMEKAQNKGEISIYVVEINAEEIDTNGLSFAMRKGIESLLKALGDYALQYKILQKELEINDTNNGDKRERFTIVIDGNTIFNAQIPQYLQELGLSVKTLVKADSLLSVVSCASIAAKVCKDRQMCALDKLYPQYKLAKNKGYGTLEHRKSIAQYGYCPHHRKSFAFNALKLL